MTAKQTVCRDCGAPRDMSIPWVKCRACFYKYMNAKTAESRRRKGKRVVEFKGLESRERVKIEAAYKRLGLEKGKVWAMVRRS